MHVFETLSCLLGTLNYKNNLEKQHFFLQDIRKPKSKIITQFWFPITKISVKLKKHKAKNYETFFL